MLATPITAVAMVVSVMAVATPAAQAAPAAAVVQSDVNEKIINSDELATKDFRAVKQNLDQSSLERTVEETDGVWTTTYMLETGGELVVAEPKGKDPEMSTQVSAGGCGFLSVCVYFTPTEQRMILAGNGFLLVAGICAVTGPPGCAVAGFVVAVAAAYLNDQVCSYRLRIRVLPTVGRATCV